MKSVLRKKVEDNLLNNYERFYRLAYSYVHNEHDALDIVQESAYKAIKECGKLKNSDYIITWIYRIIINTSLDFLRKSKHDVPLEATNESGVYDKYNDANILEYLKPLEEQEQKIIILHFFDELKLREIASIMNEPESTIKSKLYRALKKLKPIMVNEHAGF